MSARPSPSGTSVLARPADAGLPERGRISAQGVITRITLAPAVAAPSFSVLARITWKGATQDVQLLWMGQRRIPGIDAGVALGFEGMLTRIAGLPTVHNPRYEIIGKPEEN